ncbi:lytic transglycosylase domain-containing protein [Sideroxydans lithotrophicus]|uniref:Lytic transglycosylase catalytic n=1 Tax=Sideroxydans lithotrophicus (strain ES-1) TaxID=580332 RepID=D5CU71_SIDLE|nr:lytic transglycosylase domain-containing protein [Sideroxydans lithotrophicus]ADE10406.1 Lytic transglycosylase catalytic [Sideroxydans lithotrophicus ES-1]
MKFVLLLLLALPACALADQESDFRAAREALRVGNAERLDQLAERLKDSPLEPYVTYYQLRMHWGSKATEPIKAFLARSNESPVVDQFRSEWLKYLGEHGSWAEFAEEYAHLVNTDDELTCYALQLREQTVAAGALAQARKMWFSGDDTPDSCTPLFDEGLKQGVIGEDDVWQRMRLALENNNTALARELIRKLPKAQVFPAAELTMAARYPRHYLERTKFDKAGKGRRLAALFALQRLARQSPQIAFAHWEHIANYFTEEEQRYFFGWQGYAGALAHDERALQWFSVAGDAALNSKELAWRTRAALRAQNWHEVWESINAMSPQQQSEGAWRYWKGRALKILGRPDEANALFTQLSREYNFYGQLASEELGAAPGAGMSSAHYLPTDAEIEAMQAQPAIQRTLLLYRMDMRTEAAKEWAWATRNFTDQQLLVAAAVAQHNEMYDRSINAADRTVQLHDFNLRYPAPYRDAMQENLHKHGLEEAWVYGLMRQESRFATKAKSDVGAAGLMQIMPDTARWVARQIGMKGYRKGLIHQLDVNIKLGTFYMKTVSHQFDDNPVLASAAYNAGPTRARQWCGTQPMEGAIYVETIPFDETRDYVRKVLSNTMYYSKLFGQTSQSLKQRLGTIEAVNEKNQRSDRNER